VVICMVSVVLEQPYLRAQKCDRHFEFIFQSPFSGIGSLGADSSLR
jgi:hypothetical protein